MLQRNLTRFFFITSLLVFTGCQRSLFDKQTVAPATLRDVPALKLNFRFESDVPAPPPNQQNQVEEKNAAVQTDFDQTRPQELLEKTLSSPDKNRFLAVYRKGEDMPGEYRLDMYGADGKLVRKITPSGMTVHYPDTIVWSPDSANVAFMAMTRVAQTSALPESAPNPQATSQQTPLPDANTNANTEPSLSLEANANIDANSGVLPPPEPPKPVLTFRTEQIYVCNAEGVELRPLTQNEGLIYFYFVWAPDGSALAALAATWKEWQFSQLQAEQHGEIFVPAGRPRLIEKNGRERRLDDNVTTVQPVWSPDSAKVALAFDKEIRIYDAIGEIPSQAAIPLRNPLLISSKSFDEELQRKEQNASTNPTVDANTNANANVNANINVNTNTNVNTNASPALTDVNTLPDGNSLVSFNPIVRLEWTEDKMLYLQTAYIKEMKNESLSARSYQRWHRLMFSPQATVIN